LPQSKVTNKNSLKFFPFRIYCKRLNFREGLIFPNFANRLRCAKNRSREQFVQYFNTTEARFASRKLELSNHFKFPALA
ncbi:MAG: hypothetical protein PV344_06430, partial [Anaplasma sp.]|nr:hypothetical protein [Anaplasma sp.]